MRGCACARSPGLIVVLGLLCSGAAAGEFQLNSYTPDDQTGVGVSMTPSGEFVATWQGLSLGSDQSSSSVQARLFDANGVPLGIEFQVNTHTTDFQGEPSVGMDPSGQFVVTWHSRKVSSPQPLEAIQGRRYASDGTPFGDEFEISPAARGKGTPSVGMDAAGGFVVAWQAEELLTIFPDVFARGYAGDGMPVGPEFQVNEYTTSYQFAARLAVGVGGEFVVVWQSFGSPGNDVFGSSVQARLYDAAGTALGSQFQVNTYTLGAQGAPKVAKGPGGDFVVVWHSFGSAGPDTDQYSVWGRRYATDGTPLSGEFAVNTYTTGDQQLPAVAVSGTGEFLAVWESDWTGSGDSEVQARRFRADGTPVGLDFQVNSYTTGRQGGASVAADGQGNFVVVWSSAGSTGTDTSGFSAQGAREVAELQITNDDGVTTAVPGGTLTYTITASHVTGLQAVLNATVADAFSPMLSCTWTCSGTGGGVCMPGPVSGPISDAVVLPVASSVTYTANCAISPTAAGSIVTTATVSGSPGLFDPVASNNAATDVDGLQGLTIDDVSLFEGNSGTTAFGFTVTLASPLATPVMVDYGTVDGTATAGSDYMAASGTLSFAPGETTKSVPVGVIGDTTFEADETFFVALSNAVGSFLVDGVGVGTILNDDSAVPSGSLDELVHGSAETRSLETQAGPTAIAQEWRLRQAPFASYEVVVDGVTGDLGPDGPALDRLASDGSVVQQAVGATGGTSRSLRWENGATAVGDERIRVQSRGCILDCDAADSFRIRLYETTLHGARFNNSATQITILVVQDASGQGVTGHLDFWGGTGTLLHSEALALGPRQTLVVNTAGLAGLAGQAGSITVRHDGSYGSLQGKAVAVEPATGFTFDTPLEPRRR
jgi:hypothetical protein